MKKLALTSAVILSILAAAGMVNAANWQPVTSFTGTGSQTTDYFTIPTGEWRITWSFTPKADLTNLSLSDFWFFVHAKGDNTYVSFVSKSGATETSGTTYIHQGEREYYLAIDSVNVDSYQINIEYDQTTNTNITTPVDTQPGPTPWGIIIVLATGISVVTLFIAVKYYQSKKRV